MVCYLVMAPELAENIEQLELEANDDDDQLLLDLFNFIKQTPGCTTASILAHWLSKNADDILKILGMECQNESTDHQAQELTEALLKLQKNKHHEKLASQLHAIKNSTDQDFEQQKQALAQFIREKSE